MEILGRIFFRNNPKHVRNRKLQLLRFTIAACVLVCAIVGLLVYFLNQHPWF
jgi:hypothetical protein